MALEQIFIGYLREQGTLVEPPCAPPLRVTGSFVLPPTLSSAYSPWSEHSPEISKSKTQDLARLPLPSLGISHPKKETRQARNHKLLLPKINLSPVLCSLSQPRPASTGRRNTLIESYFSQRRFRLIPQNGGFGKGSWLRVQDLPESVLIARRRSLRR